MERLAVCGELLRGEDWGSAQFLDELFAVFAVSESALFASCFFVVIKPLAGCYCEITHLLERLVINKASCILGYVELTLLDVLAEFPGLQRNRLISIWAFATYLRIFPVERRVFADVHGRRRLGLTPLFSNWCLMSTLCRLSVCRSTGERRMMGSYRKRIRHS